ncbi:beta-ketoacyl reductase, partial [Nocardia sp. NPDC005978]|uniref:acyl carrier protein n=1 Tax=Nocardia sp. NPDC005978 TaxID=3156725 RepID=UPI0033AF9912
ATHRRTQGLPAQSMAWGLWNLTSGMATHLTDNTRRRLASIGVSELGRSDGLTVFDRAIQTQAPTPILMAFSAPPRDIAVPPLLREVFAGRKHLPQRKAAKSTHVPNSLNEMSPEELQAAVTKIVSTQMAVALGYANGTEIDQDAAFQDLGFDSLAAMEFRNGLAEAVGIRLSPALAFQYPTARQLAIHIAGEMSPPRRGQAAEPREDRGRQHGSFSSLDLGNSR